MNGEADEMRQILFLFCIQVDNKMYIHHYKGKDQDASHPICCATNVCQTHRS